jgi:hypothetical protein
MRIMGRGPVLALAVAAAIVTAQPVTADNNNPNGSVFRAVGFYKGKGEITAGEIKCDIPTVGSGIQDGAFSMGLWNTYGFQTLFFPDINQPFANPCGGWIQMQNNLLDQGLVVDRIEMQARIPGARSFRQFVVTRNGFPVACRDVRKATLFDGIRLNPVNSSQESSVSGAANVAFLQLLPMISPQLLSCLRGQYAGVPTTTFTSLPVVVRVSVVATSDSGTHYRSNTIQYTVNLRHTCGNGRVDDGEFCDPNTSFNSCAGFCGTDGKCSQDDRIPCVTDADCIGTCIAPDDPSECICLY